MSKILIIEHDNELMQKTASYLSQHGFEIIKANEGSVGVQKALEILPDIILCDSNTPGLNGYEILNTLQQINTTAVIPFIFIIENANYEDLRAVMRLGADDYIVKPYDLYDLLELVKTRLEKQERIINIADEKFNTLMEFSTNGVFIYRNEKLSYVNRKFCEIVSYTQKELLGMNLVNIVYKDDIHSIVEKIDRCFKGIEKELHVDFRAISRDKSIVNVNLNGSCIAIRGKKSIIGMMRTLTDEHSSLFSVRKLPIKITKREKEILNYICEGHSNVEISNILNISERTVEGHRANLIKKTGCKNSACLAIFAIKYGLFQIK